jgi:Tfp pilus assembly protein PilO
MNADALLLPLARIPWSIVGLLVGLWFGWDYYQFETSSESELNLEKARIGELRQEVTLKTTKLQEVEQFRRTVDQRRAQLSEMTARLNEKRLAVSEKFDAAEFVGVINTEARRVGLEVIKLDPQSSSQNELYAEHPFKLVFRGVFVQFLVFMERIANLQKIVRVDQFDVGPARSARTSQALVELEGNLELKVYRYLSTSADSISSEIQLKGATQGAGATQEVTSGTSGAAQTQGRGGAGQ